MFLTVVVSDKTAAEMGKRNHKVHFKLGEVLFRLKGKKPEARAETTSVTNTEDAVTIPANDVMEVEDPVDCSVKIFS